MTWERYYLTGNELYIEVMECTIWERYYLTGNELYIEVMECTTCIM